MATDPAVKLQVMLYSLQVVADADRACAAGVVCHKCPSAAQCRVRHEPVKSS